MKMHKGFFFAISLLIISGANGQYEFELTCGDTLATVVLPVDVVCFFIGLENTGSLDDVYRITLSNRTPDWSLLFCAGGICCPAGGIIYDTLSTGQQELIEVKFSNIREPGTGKGVLHVQSIGDTARLDSITLWVLASTSIQTETEDAQIPHRPLANWPNPFTQSTTIAYQLFDDQDISLKIYDAEGQWVKTVANNKMSAGHYIHYWDGKDEIGRRVPPGIYFCVFRTKNSASVCKMVRLRG